MIKRNPIINNYIHGDTIIYLNTCSCTLYTDIPNCFLPGGGTLNPDIFLTLERPDIVIIQEDKTFILELTVLFENITPEAHSRKSDEYAHFISYMG